MKRHLKQFQCDRCGHVTTLSSGPIERPSCWDELALVPKSGELSNGYDRFDLCPACSAVARRIQADREEILRAWFEEGKARKGPTT